MGTDRTTLRATAAFERRPSVSSRVQRSTAEIQPSPARTLQQRIGNQATQILIARSIASQTRDTETPASVTVTAPTSVQYSKWTRLPLKVSKQYDPAELEAEETARKVMRMQESPKSAPLRPSVSPPPKGSVQRAEAVAPARTTPPSTPRVSIAGGSPLPATVRSHMEPRFAANFSNVRIHTGEAAAHQSENLNAHAFTVGDHIFFGRNKFQPHSASGKQLIAHEL